MKLKLFLLASFILVLCFACSDDDDTNSKRIGKWYFYSFTDMGTDKDDYVPCLWDTYIELYEGGEGLYHEGCSKTNYQFTWSAENKTADFSKITDQKNVITEINHMDEKELTLRDLREDGSYFYHRYKKK